MPKYVKEESNVDKETILGFGDEWKRFDQTGLSDAERKEIFDKYFSLFPWDKISKNSEGFDLGCGSGRWALLVSPRVGKLHCIDPSSAIEVAKKNLSHLDNCIFHQETVDSMSIDDSSMDFGYSLGVLHHIPNTRKGINECVRKLRSGAPFLLYLYYALENRPIFFRILWIFSNQIRLIVSRMPVPLKFFSSQLIAFFVYWPLAKVAYLIEKIGINTNSFPLSEYRDKSFYTMKTDALDRFGTRIEKRFTLEEIREMMLKAGLKNISYRDSAPYWCLLGYKEGE